MKSVYTGGEKVAEFESYDELRVGDGKPAFIYEGSELVYPNPVKDGLVLWYDFSGRTNADGQRGIAEDLSGNGNHGTLQNFNYTAESGYDKNKLLFDGVDDSVSVSNPLSEQNDSQYWSVEFVTAIHHSNYSIIIDGLNLGIRSREASDNMLRIINYTNTIGFIYSSNHFNIGDVIYCVASYDYTNATTSIFINGVEDSNINTSDYIPSGMSSELRINRRHLADLYSLKIYNRPLTPEEIAHNYAIEKERFDIE